MRAIMHKKLAKAQLLFLTAITLVSAGAAFLLALWWSGEVDARTARSQTIAAEEVKQVILSEAQNASSGSLANPKETRTKPQTRVIGVLEIPKLGLQRVIAEGITNKTLNDPHSGVGHYPGTALPGERGNFAITGHRNGNGGTFFDLDKIDKGDLLRVISSDGIWNYRVTKTEVVYPEDNEALLNLPYASTITITTCHPKWSDKQRLVVVGELEL
ncbi:MAG: class E sortase [Microbacteriaceae bacterium]|nr:class E sortase [Microbacteriaceae bacterium]